MSDVLFNSKQKNQVLQILTDEGKKALAELTQNYKSDLTSNSHIIWTSTKKNAVYQLAGKFFFDSLWDEFNSHGMRPIERAEFSHLWNQVVRQVLVDPSWKNLPDQDQEELLEPHEVVSAQERKIFKEFIPYLFILVGGGMLIKVLILYLGSHGYLSFDNP